MSRVGFVVAITLASIVAIALPGRTHAALLDTSFGGASFKDTSLGGTTSAARPELAGTVLEDVEQAFSVPALNISGNVLSRVVREDGTGTLDFYWRVTVDPTSTGGGVRAFRLSDFGFGNITDGDWRQDSSGTAAARTARVFNPTSYPSGSVNFIFNDPIVLPGDPASNLNGSHSFFLHTSATHYAMTANYDLLVGQNETLTSIFHTFRPSEVPEPAAALLAVFGIAWASLVRKGR